MPGRPIFVATHPRACSTAFERVFMTRRDILNCIHEPFGDAFYFGPERLSERFENDEAARLKSGFSNTTYKDVMDKIMDEVNEDKRVFIKDIAYYLCPPDGKPATLAPSLCKGEGHVNGATQNGTSKGPEEPGNPTVIPSALLRKFHFTFLIRHPRYAIPSYFRCTVPPLADVTGFHYFMPSEAGYNELRRLFDYLKDEGIVGPSKFGEPNGEGDHVSITVVDADDLLDKPAEVIEAFCKAVGIDYTPDMLRWTDEKNQRYAVESFEKWNGFHNDVIGSTCLKPRAQPKKTRSTEEEDAEWREKFGEEGQKTIRACVEANVADYEYLKSFAIQV